MRGRTTLAVALCTLAASCGGEEAGGLPPACGEGPEAVQRALDRAPGAVRMDGTPLSDCLTPDADGSDLQNVGLGFVETAAVLSPRARARPEGREALELGYLVGAAHRGGDTAPGFHTELLRRIDQEASDLRARSAAFRRGERAGRRSG